MTKALDLTMKYQKLPFEDPNTWPNLEHDGVAFWEE